MEPKNFEVKITYNAEMKKAEIQINDTITEVQLGVNTVKDILEFLQRIIIKRFC